MVQQVTEPDALAVVEALTRLKGAYFRLMDARDWGAWGDVLTEDCVMILNGDPAVRLEGRDAIVESAGRNLDPRVGLHLGHMPEIDVTGADTATGRWTLLAYSTALPEHGQAAQPGMLSLGTYVDTYRRDDDGRWRIATTSLSTVIRVVDRATAATLGPSDGLLIET